jgi:hypothetical protein
LTARKKKSSVDGITKNNLSMSNVHEKTIPKARIQAYELESNHPSGSQVSSSITSLNSASRKSGISSNSASRGLEKQHN